MPRAAKCTFPPWPWKAKITGGFVLADVDGRNERFPLDAFDRPLGRRRFGGEPGRRCGDNCQDERDEKFHDF